METNWLAIDIAGKDVELTLNQKLAAGLSALKFCHRRGKLLYILGSINGKDSINLKEILIVHHENLISLSTGERLFEIT